VVVENALRKARSMSAERVLGVDTVVSCGGRLLGKPRHQEEARSFLEQLQGREHEVWSGLALLDGGGERTAASVTAVRFRCLDRADIDWYLASGEWRERAGGYAIQGRGAALVERIDGDYNNVVGLPVAELLRLAPELVRP
jgi:septum formation protein